MTGHAPMRQSSVQSRDPWSKTMRNPRLTVTMYLGCDLTEDEITAVHLAAVDAAPERADLSVSSARLSDASQIHSVDGPSWALLWSRTGEPTWSCVGLYDDEDKAFRAFEAMTPTHGTTGRLVISQVYGCAFCDPDTLAAVER